MYLHYNILAPKRKGREELKRRLPAVQQHVYPDGMQSFIQALVVEVGSTREALIKRKEIDRELSEVKRLDRSVGWMFNYVEQVPENPFDYMKMR
jgi:hypothetical protein